MDKEDKKPVKGEGRCWKVTPCVWSSLSGALWGRRVCSMLIFKSLGGLFGVGNWYLPMEEFPTFGTECEKKKMKKWKPVCHVCPLSASVMLREISWPDSVLFPLAFLELNATVAPDHTYCLFYDFPWAVLRIPTVCAKLPIIETFNKQAQKCKAFVWFGREKKSKT